jgi:hypothetical protein
VFAELEEIKHVDREALLGEKKEYNVHDYYKQVGAAQRIARHPLFENFYLFVIAVNALWMGYDLDQNTALSIDTAEPQFMIIETIFCVLFTVEVGVWLMAFERKLFPFTDPRELWFKLDFTLVLEMFFDAWMMPLVIKPLSGGDGMTGQRDIVEMIRMLRLMRMTRMIRIMRAVPVFMTIIKGMAAALRSVSATMFLMGLVLYVYGIVFRAQLATYEEPTPMFSNVPESMFSLFMAGTLLDDIFDVGNTFYDKGFFMMLLFLSYLLISCFTILNMLIGVLCEVVSSVSAHEAEKKLIVETQKRLEEVYLEHVGEDGGEAAPMDKDEFWDFLHVDSVEKALFKIGVESKHFRALTALCFPVEDKDDKSWGNLNAPSGPKRITPDEFVKTVVRLRPEKSASVMDVAEIFVGLRTDIRSTRNDHEADLEELQQTEVTFENDVNELLKRMKRLEARIERWEDHHLDQVKERTAGLPPELLVVSQKLLGKKTVA